MFVGAEQCFKLASLTSLDLSMNPTYGNEGLKNFLTSYQAHNKVFHLQRLFLRNINLVGVSGPDGRASLEQLCLFLSLPNCSVTALDLSGNPLLGDDGMRTFFRGVRDNKTLKYLNLSETSLTAKRSGTLISRFLMDNKVGTCRLQTNYSTLLRPLRSP